MTLRTALSLCTAGAALTLLAACGSDASAPSGTGTEAGTPAEKATAAATGSDDSACDVTDPQTVTAVFGGTSAPEKAGEARNCEYTLTGAKASLVEVYALGPSSAWDSQKKQAADIGGPLTPVQVGDEAYSLKTPPNTIYVKDGGRIIGVQVVDVSSTKSYLSDLTTLAGKIVG